MIIQTLYTAEVQQQNNLEALRQVFCDWRAKAAELRTHADQAFLDRKISKRAWETIDNLRVLTASIASEIIEVPERFTRRVFIAYDSHRELRGVLVGCVYEVQNMLDPRKRQSSASISSLVVNPDNLDLLQTGKPTVKKAGSALLERALSTLGSSRRPIHVLSYANAVPFYKKFGFSEDSHCGDQEGERCVYLISDRSAAIEPIQHIQHNKKEPDCTAFLPPLRTTCDFLRYARLKGFLAKSGSASTAPDLTSS